MGKRYLILAVAKTAILPLCEGDDILSAETTYDTLGIEEIRTHAASPSLV